MTLTYQGKLFAEYPDVVSVKQMCIIHHLKIGKSFKIPKICVIEYLLG